uniref:Reverse transcriptase domain-containing protein n=1 Tax=Trichuris muris TaxID=70415 RepID=A0A5S6QNW5_TRIMR
MEMVDASNNVMQLAGYFKCQMSLNNRHGKGRCFVTTKGKLNLLGLDWIDQLQLWNMSSCGAALHGILGSQHKAEHLTMDIQNLYPKVCNAELGHCTKFKASLSLRPDAQPVFKRKRPVPYAALSLVEQELDRLEQLGIISKIDYSNWAAPIVAVKKANGTVRLCADFSTGLNEALEHHQYPLPLPEDIFATLNGGQYFSKIDLADAYLQVEVDEKSKELLTINTHRGLYRYNRLPFVVKSAPAIFQ